MECYYLFRGDEIVYRANENQTGSLGAGDSHAHGQAGDVLICVRGSVLRGWRWIKPGTSIDMPWKDIPDKDLDHAKYRVLLLLQG